MDRKQPDPVSVDQTDHAIEARSSLDGTRLGRVADKLFIDVEHVAYVALGLLLALTAILALGSAAITLWASLRDAGAVDAIILTIDRLLFVLMLVEILHTVGVSLRSGTLTCEPFLIVGLIASIRRVLLITLESSQVNQPGKWTPEGQPLFDNTMMELVVLGGLILIMVISIYLLRLGDAPKSGRSRQSSR